MKQELRLENRVNLPFESYPVRHGVPWPRGQVMPETALSARDEEGRPVPCASRVLNRWPDASVQWSLVDLAVDLEPSGRRTIRIGTEPAGPAGPVNPVEVSEEDGRITVTNGLTTLSFARGPLVERWAVGDRPVIEAASFDVIVTDETGVPYSAAAAPDLRLFVEDASPLCAVVRVEGKHGARHGGGLLDFWLRFRVTANRPDVKITYHYRNLEDAEPGINLRSMVMRFRAGVPAASDRVILQASRGRFFRTEYVHLREDFEIASSDTMDLENYQRTHQDRGIYGGGEGRVFIRRLETLRDDMSLKPWFLRNVVDFKFGRTDPPEAFVFSHVALASPKGSIVVAGGNMVGLHPKSLRVEGNLVEYGIWPEWAGTMDITQGEGRTLDFYVGPLPPDATHEQIANQYFSWEMGALWAHFPVRPPVGVSLDPEHVRRCEVFWVDKLPAYDPDLRFAFERKVRRVWTPEEVAPATGHLHYGDVPGSWTIGTNNDEMAGLVWFQEYLRSGRAECLDRALALAQHIADVDIVAYSSDPYQNGGMCAHGPRHNHCAAYPSHMWFTELLCAYALTGDGEFKKAAARACDNLVFWVNDPRGFECIAADGRESGQPLTNLSWAYSFIPDQRYMDAMWRIVRDAFMAKVRKHGGLVHMKPHEGLPWLRAEGYGDWAAWEGLYYFWDLTRDEELRQFMLGLLQRRVTEEQMGTHGGFRAGADYNVAAHAYYMTGDRAWLDRVARAFRATFREVEWSLSWLKSMYFIKLAFDHGIVTDEDVVIS